jgi:hypothetical protein
MRTINLLSVLILISAVIISCSGESKKEKKIVADRSTEFRIKGDSIIKMTFDTLRSALTGNIAKEGVANTVEYCNTNAYPITAVHASDGITIRRSSVKVRNPKNAPDSLELAVLTQYESKIAGGDSLTPVVIRYNNTYHYFKPIMLQSICMNCHGEPGRNIPQEVMQVISAKYPTDKAIGYSEGQLRGTWHVSFSSNKH